MSDDELIEAFTHMIKVMRADARRAIEYFFLNATDGIGGALWLLAPCTFKKRNRFEAGHKTEQWGEVDSLMDGAA